MSEEKLPDEVSAFIFRHIDSTVQLEILLLLHKDRQRQWTAQEIDAQLKVNPQWIASQVNDLCRRGFLHCTEEQVPRYQYAPADVKLESAVAAVAQWYATHWVAIISMIHSKSTDKIRAFAEAFRLRSDKPHG